METAAGHRLAGEVGQLNRWLAVAGSRAMAEFVVAN